MATDATGTVSTNYLIPKYLTSADAPSGKGLNAIVDYLDTLLKSQFPGFASAITGTPSSTTYLRGDGSWQVPPVGTQGSEVLLASQVLGATLATFDTSSAALLNTTIPNTYSHLKIIVVGRNDTVAATQSLRIRFNGDVTAGDYSSSTLLSGTTTTASASTIAATAAGAWIGNMNAASATASIPTVLEFIVPVYAKTTFFKTWTARVSTPGVEQDIITGEWASTAAITKIELLGTAGNFIAGTAFYLYGVL